MTLRSLFLRLVARRDNTTSTNANAPKASAGQLDWLRHAASAPAAGLLAELNTTEEGLNSASVDTARELWGANAQVHATARPLPRRLAAAFADPFTYILMLIAAVSVLTDWAFAAPGTRDLTTPLIIGAMVLVSGVLRFIQDEKSAAAASTLAELVETCANVERDGDGGNETPVDEIVVGDVVHLSSGDVVPADLRIIAARDLFVSQASLTGESDPVEKSATPLSPTTASEPANAAVTDLPTLALMGSTVISGHGRGVVVATGARTMFGEATGMLAGRRRTTATDRGIAATSRLLMRLMLVVLPVVFVVSSVTKGNWVDALLFSLSVAVGLTPEMLPMLVTTCLGKGAVDLSGEQVIVKRLDAVQDLGGIDILCTDKTGTLTEDRIVLERYLNVAGQEDARVLRQAFLNSYLSTGVKNLIDNAIIDRARAEAAAASGARGDAAKTGDLAAGRYAIDELPFDFERRRLSVVVGDERGRTAMITKGAIEEVLAVCSAVEVDGTTRPLDGALAAQVMARAAALASEGMRVLGVARKDNPTGGRAICADDERDMTLVGYLAFLDPPKASAAAAVAALAGRGVATKVLTGDSARVAAHVCGRIGIDASHVLTGADVERMDDATLAQAAQEASVFAKLSPSQKARVVRVLGELGHSVGYMGDGVNDAAAMRASDCAISVDSAVDVAREAADIILLEKDLMVIERGIEFGRRTFANMSTYVRLTVSSNFGNIISVLVAAAALPFLPMGAVQLLLLNLIYDVTCCAIPWDCVDDERIARPSVWSTRATKRFMLAFGPVSSVFDIVTFAALFFLVCPAVAGGAWGALDEAGRAAFVGAFQAGWFIESMWTQTLVIHLLRTDRTPFLESRAAFPPLAMGFAGVALATALPFSPMAGALDFVAPGAAFFPVLLTIVAGFAACVLLVRRFVKVD